MSIMLYNERQTTKTNHQHKPLTDHIQTKNGQVVVVAFQPGHFQFLLRFLCRRFFQKMSDLNTFCGAATATVLCFAFTPSTGRCLVQPSTRHRPKRRHVFNGTGGQAQQRSAVGTPRFTGLDHLLHTASAVVVGGFVNVVSQHLRERENSVTEKVC